MKLNGATLDARDLVKLYTLPSLASVEAGNRVMLKSGGPEMTVIEQIGGQARVNWMDRGRLIEAEFDLQVLTCHGAR